MTVPRVTIGLPVYNGQDLLPRALRALAAQQLADFDLSISDNCSDDRTEDICRQFASDDPRCRYIRQPRNIGAVANFLFVLEQARTPYFMWAAHDDYWLPEFASANCSVLDSRDDVVLSVSQMQFVDGDGDVVGLVEPGTEPLLGSARENLVKYLENPAANSRFYGIHRTEVIRKCARLRRSIWAQDWLIMARTLKFGKHFEVDRCLFHRSARGMSSQAEKLIPQYHKSWLFQRMPMLPFTWAMLVDRHVPKTWAVRKPLWKWNKRYFDDRYATYCYRRERKKRVLQRRADRRRRAA